MSKQQKKLTDALAAEIEKRYGAMFTEDELTCPMLTIAFSEWLTSRLDLIGDMPSGWPTGKQASDWLDGYRWNQSLGILELILRRYGKAFTEAIDQSEAIAHAFLTEVRRLGDWPSKAKAERWLADYQQARAGEQGFSA